jgi:L-asparaginase II
VAIPLVRVIRSELEESIHAGDVAVVDGDGRLLAFAGDPSRIAFARSSMKPVQAAVSLSLTDVAFEADEVAVMCASHNAEPIHVATVRSLLRRAGVPEDELLCPEVRPWDDETLGADPTPRRINSDCSGKHGGMLAACHAQGWPPATYRDPGHPLQHRVGEAVRAGSAADDIRVGVDGCGVPVHGMTLAGLATIYARLAAPGRWDGVDLGATVERAVRAMRTRPYLVAGRNRVDTALMETVPGLVVKAGAEGLVCASVLERGLGVAVKIEDGSSRASGPALIHALSALDVVEEGHRAALESFVGPPVLGGGHPVGELRAGFELTRA